MIRRGAYLNVVDNSGARVVQVIGIPGTGNPQRAYTGDMVTVAVKSLRKSAIALAIAAGQSGTGKGKGGKGKKGGPRVTKGSVAKAVLVRAKKEPRSDCYFADNAAVLRLAKGDPMGVRATGPRASNPLYHKARWKIALRSAQLLDR